MSLENSFNKIKRSAGIKKCVLIDGNVGDVYLDENNKIVTLREYLEQILKDMEYQDIVYWDRVEGATGAIDKLQVIDEVEVEGDNYDFDDEETPKSQQGLFKAPSEILNVVYKNVINKKMKVAFILNWSEYLFSTTGLSEDERQNITLSKQVELTEEQQNGANILVKKINNGFSTTLLDGITGSGKTEVYFEAIAQALSLDKQVLVLVPEISLTSQWLKRFETRFGVTPFIWHSEVSLKNKAKTWKAVIKGDAKVIVGARSALFLPFSDIGIIVVDESHDHSFKQESLVTYQGRDMAVLRASIEKIPVILSTATPDLETIINVEEGKYDCVKLRKRFAKAVLPEIKIIDIKKDKPQKGNWGISFITPTLVDELKKNLDKGEQSMLFLNRRGYAPLLICRDCGHRIQCPHCSAWLAEHRISGELICHHCGLE